MKSAVAFSVFLLTAVALEGPIDEKYTDRYDNVDLDEILANRRLLVPYVKCILEQGQCTPDGKELKEHIREALENECSKCTEKQLKGTERVIGHLINHEPEYWNELSDKYDPEKKYTTRYETHLRKLKA